MKNYLKGFACALALMAGVQSVVAFASEHNSAANRLLKRQLNRQSAFIQALLKENTTLRNSLQQYVDLDDDEALVENLQMMKSLKKKKSSDDEPPLESPLI